MGRDFSLFPSESSRAAQTSRARGAARNKKTSVSENVGVRENCYLGTHDWPRQPSSVRSFRSSRSCGRPSKAHSKGKAEAVELALVALLARGHLLIEDVPGVEDHARSRLARSVGGELRRVQFTSDCFRAMSWASPSTPARREVRLPRTISRTCSSPTKSIARAPARNPRSRRHERSAGLIDGETIRCPIRSSYRDAEPQDFAAPSAAGIAARSFMLRCASAIRRRRSRCVSYSKGTRIPARDVPVVLRSGAARCSPATGRPHQHRQRVLTTCTVSSRDAHVTRASRSAHPRAVRCLSAKRLARRALVRDAATCIADDIHDLAVPVLAIVFASHARGRLRPVP